MYEDGKIKTTSWESKNEFFFPGNAERGPVDPPEVPGPENVTPGEQGRGAPKQNKKDQEER